MLNKTFLIGHVGNDFKKTGDNRGYFSLYTTERTVNGRGERIELTETHIIGVSGNLTKIAEDIVKTGRIFFVEAKLKHVLSEENGKKSTATFLNAVFLKMLSKSTKEILASSLHGNDVNTLNEKAEIESDNQNETDSNEGSDYSKPIEENKEETFNNQKEEDDDIPF